MNPVDTLLRIASRLDLLGSDRDAARLREIVKDIQNWQARWRDTEALAQRLCQCEGELTHIRQITIGLEPRTSKNQEPKSPRVR